MFTDDQDIERTLKAALNVEAPTGFEAGVRQRLERQTPARRFAVPAWLAAAAALVMLAGGWYLAARDSRVVEPVTMADNVPPPAPVSVPAPSPAPAPDVVAVRPSTPRGSAPRPDAVRAPAPVAAVARRAEPEVIVPPNQLEMIERLMRDVHAGRVELPEQIAAVAEAPAELIVPPVLVGAIPVPALEVTTPPALPSKGLK
jgi:hypothetical protein